MKNLFIIDGAAGTGKSDLLKYVTRDKRETCVLKKITTRDKRTEEEVEDYILDLDFDKDKFTEHCLNKNFYKYSYVNNQYGFLKSDLEESLSKHDNVFVIIRNNDLVKKLRVDFPKVKVINVYIYSDKEKTEQRLRALGYDETKIQFRLARNDYAWNDYVKHYKDYDEVLVNNSDIVHYEAQIDQLIDKYNQEDSEKIELSNEDRFTLIKPLIGHKKDIVDRINKYPYEKNVFLMMRFRPYNKHLHTHIEQIIKNNGFNCVRADMPEWNITNNVYNPVAVLYACKYGIVLFDEPKETEKNQYNPNVAYELAMMHLQRKDCLVLKHASLDKIPFDIIKDLYSEYNYQEDMTPYIENWMKNIKK